MHESYKIRTTEQNYRWSLGHWWHCGILVPVSDFVWCGRRINFYLLSYYSQVYVACSQTAPDWYVCFGAVTIGSLGYTSLGILSSKMK